MCQQFFFHLFIYVFEYSNEIVWWCMMERSAVFKTKQVKMKLINIRLCH